MAITRDDPRRLARRKALLEGLGQPQRGVRVVHVAGTNGKGSVVAMVARGLALTGRRVGAFTSPDLSGPHERFALNGLALTPDQLAKLEARVAPAIAAAEAAFPEIEPLGAFERWCAAAWLWFAEAGLDYAVVEAGIGGRHDPTNVLREKVLTLVTSIGPDHADRIGPALADIAHEKAGIFMPGVPALTSARGEALAWLQAEAPVTYVEPLKGKPLRGGGWDLGGGAILALDGRHQLENAGLACAALRTLGVDERTIRAALASVAWPGRMEHLPDPHGGGWLLDGAHNLPAAEALVQSWGNPAVVVAGFQAGKDAAAMVPLLTAGQRPLIALPVPGAAASWEPEALRAHAAGPVIPARDVPEALAVARAIAPGGLRVVAGSLYLVGAARAHLSACLPLAREGAS